MEAYTPEIEATMREFYTSLNERDRRRYAGLEALKLGHGGQHYIARVLGCSRRTVRKGAQEVSGLSNQAIIEQIGFPPPRQHGFGEWAADANLTGRLIRSWPHSL